MKRHRIGLSIGALIVALSVGSAGLAQALGPRDFDVPAQDLKYALRAVAQQSGLELVATSDALRGKQAPALKGHYTPVEAMTELLRGTGLTAEIAQGTVIIRGRPQPPMAAADDLIKTSDIVVTGTRIRGAIPASPTITQTQEQIRRSGLTNLGDFARSLPQSFAGGQNPGVAGGVRGDNNENLSSASSLNLRGLGPDATLTLLNGHRVAYNGAVQAIDISAIPLAAVDRVEIITDGASAIYGSDAVAGVANVVLKRSFDGLSITARGGVATDGGDHQQEYSAVAGLTGSHAGFIATYDFERDTPLLAGQRSFTDEAFPSTRLLPAQLHHSAILSGYWQPTTNLTASADLLFSSRHSTIIQPLMSDDYTVLGYRRTPATRSYSISSKLEWTLPNNWKALLLGSFAEDRTDVNTRLLSSGTLAFASTGPYRNRSTLAELNAEGSLVSLPAGDVRLAIGGGYRANVLKADLATTTAAGTVPSVQFSKGRHSFYGFGELYVPVVSTDQNILLIDHLSLSGAVRYEDYPGMAKVATPKLGVVYSPTGGLELKFSWGRSFKTPTLYQQFNGYEAELASVADFGAVGYPATATALFLVGGNPDLKPERARTWVASLALHPVALPALKIEASIFNIQYKNRITQAINSFQGLLSNAAYASLITFTPSITQIQDAIAGARSGLENTTTADYDPANVIAIIDSRYLNIARQKASGFDLTATYVIGTTGPGQFTLTGGATYLRSRRELTPDAAPIPAAGVIFYPPHWRARGGVIWDQDLFTVSAYGNYVGGVRDNRSTPEPIVRSVKTLDLTAVYRSRSSSRMLNGIDLTLSVLNLFNGKPDRIMTSAAYNPAFDSTNYSAVGRFVNFSITKHF